MSVSCVSCVYADIVCRVVSGWGWQLLAFLTRALERKLEGDGTNYAQVPISPLRRYGCST